MFAQTNRAGGETRTEGSKPASLGGGWGNHALAMKQQTRSSDVHFNLSDVNIQANDSVHLE